LKNEFTQNIAKMEANNARIKQLRGRENRRLNIIQMMKKKRKRKSVAKR
jgi:hypothetical protein